MNERQPAADVAAEITLWQISALQLPVGDVQSALTAALRGLARQLNDFNDTCNADPGTTGSEALEKAIVGVARQATAVAIFTLALRQRAHLAARQN